MNNTFQTAIAGQTGQGSPGDGPVPGNPNIEHNVAPGGRFFGDDLPVVNHPFPATTNGFTPSPENPPMPSGPLDGYTKPPSR